MRTVAKGTIEGRIDGRMCRTQFMCFTENVSNYAENKYKVKNEKYVVITPQLKYQEY
jgi:hypothetical protein